VFDQVFNMHANQEEVFEKTVLPLLDGVLSGYNATAFAYGVSPPRLVDRVDGNRADSIKATGCGKTHTISGNAEDPGVIVRTTRELFKRIEESRDQYDTFLELSMVEIYNEQIRDLLNDDFPASPLGGLKLLENEKERVTIDRVTLKRPNSVDEVMDLVLLGNQRRSTSYTASNSTSSRSHAVLQINIGRNSKGHEINFEQTVVRQCMTAATLSIIDLAGSERAAATRNMGERMKEGANINKSLLALSSCISALCQAPTGRSRIHVPYRNSKLTRMLKFSLGGNCRTVMIVCVSPSSRDIEDTHNTLVWADKAKNVSTKVSQNTIGVDLRAQQWAAALAEKQQQIETLKDTIARIEKGTREYIETKRALEWKPVASAIETVEEEVRSALPVILEGAAKRAEWDGVELLNAAIKQRMIEEEQAEKDYLAGVVRQHDASYGGNRLVVAMVQREASQKSTVDALLRGLEGRKFNDALDRADLDIVKLKVAVHRSEMERQILEAREKVHRQKVQQQGQAVAQAAALLHRFAAAISTNSHVLSSMANGIAEPNSASLVIELLNVLGSSAEHTLASLFGDHSTGVLPPLPRPSQAAAGPDIRETSVVSGPFSSQSVLAADTSLARLPPPQRPALGPPRRLSSVPASGASLPYRKRMSIAPGDTSLSAASRPLPSSMRRLSAAPRRMSTAPGNTSLQPPAQSPSGFLSSPAAQRLLRDTSAFKPHMAKSPAKKSKLRPALVPVHKARVGTRGTPNGTPVKKAARFRSDMSIDDVKEFEVLTSESSGRGSLGGASSGDADDSADWEEQDEVPELPSRLSAAGKSMLPPDSAVARLPSITLTKSTPTPPGSSSGSGSSGDEAKAKGNESWRQNRAYMKSLKASTSALGTVGEENMSMAGDMSFNRSSSFGLPPPVRPEPLGERKQLPPTLSGGTGAGSTSFAGTSSNLLKPTLSSASRSVSASPFSLFNRPESSNSTSSLGHGPRPSVTGSSDGRRISSIGPMRHELMRGERQKKRESSSIGRDLPPGSGTASIKAAPFSQPSHNPLAGGAKRATPLLDQGGPSSPAPASRTSTVTTTGAANASAATLQRRASAMDLSMRDRRVSAMGPLGTGQVGRGLAPRPSMSQLSRFGGTKGG
jgi:kinesin family protein 18/19